MRLGDFSRLGDASRLRDGCGALRLASVGFKWGSRARKLGGEFGWVFSTGSC